MGWFREFLAVPEAPPPKKHQSRGQRRGHMGGEPTGPSLPYSPMKGKAEVKMKNMPLLYMVKVTAKYTARLPHTKNWLTAVQ